MQLKLAGLLLLWICGAAWAEDCHVVIREDALVKQTLNGQEVYVVTVNQVKPAQCFKPVETAALIKNLHMQIADNLKLAETYKQNQESLQKLNDDYRQLIQRHEDTLNQSITLSQNFDITMQNYNRLAKDYDQLTVKFDDLAGKYRDVALTAGSPIRVELGAGLTNDGDGIGLLGVGFNVYKTWDIRAWGIVHKDFFGVLGGASFHF